MVAFFYKRGTPVQHMYRGTYRGISPKRSCPLVGPYTGANHGPFVVLVGGGRHLVIEVTLYCVEREFFIDNLLVRIRFIIEILWIGLAPWKFEFHFPGSLTFIFLVLGSLQGHLAHKKNPPVRILQ